MKKTKNVMFIIGNMRNGGAERALTNICNELKKTYNVYLVVSDKRNYDYMPDVKVFEIPNLRSNRRKIIGIIQLRKLKKELGIDIAISFLTGNNVSNYFSKYKEKIVFSVRNFMSQKRNYEYKFINICYNLVKNRVNLIVSVSESVRMDQIDNFGVNPDKIITISNFCDLKKIEKESNEKIEKELKYLFENKTVISSGRLHDQKGQWHIIRAFSKVVKKIPDAKLILTSRGALEDYYKELISDLKLENNVFLVGFVDNVYKYMKNSNIFLLNSFYEGMPNVILEAMACGLPVISTDAPGGSAEILAPDKKIGDYITKRYDAPYGILIPICDGVKYSAQDPLTKNEILLADTLIDLLNDKEKQQYYREKSLERVQDYSKENIIKKWDKIIDDAT